MIFNNNKNNNAANIILIDAKVNSPYSHLFKDAIAKEKNSHIVLYEKKTILALFAEKTKSLTDRAEKLRLFGHSMLQQAINISINFNIGELSAINISQEPSQEQDLLPFLEGMALSLYTFDKYKSEKSETKNISLNVEGISNEKLSELNKLIDSVNTARDLVNEPVISLNSLQLSSQIESLSKECGFNVEVLHKKQIEDLKMGGLLGVNLGSDVPPTFNILTYKPQNAINPKPYILVGKGVTYDTGGYNIKPGDYMAEMKSDMGGAAAVIGTLCAVSKNNLPIYVIGLIPSTDNRINSHALVADDIITMMSGTKVEIINTDAEGRLILGDALHYAKRFDPQLVIDLATLTGAAHRVTGYYGTAMMGTASQDVKNRLSQSGEQTYERLIEFPFWDEFEDDIKSSIADIKNSAGAIGGASTAGKFLQVFTSYPWLHLDIAGPAFLNKDYKYYKAGATGVGVRLLYHFLKSQTK